MMVCRTPELPTSTIFQTVPKTNISAPVAHLTKTKMKAAAGAIGFALGIIDT
jgi:hypothetical protein